MRILSYFLIIVFAPALILINFRLLVFNQNFNQNEFKKLNVYQNFNDWQVVNWQSQNLVNYLCCSQPLTDDFFTPSEKLHLNDVKKLIAITNSFLIILAVAALAIIASFLIFKKYQTAANALIWASIITIFTILLLSIYANLNFDFAFFKFHQILFTNKLWLLPPESNLIKFFPERFFVDFANRIAIQTLIESVAILVVAIFTKKILTKTHLVK